MASNKHDTDQWALGAFLQWRPKHRSASCDRCNGTGSVGGHFKDLDGPQPCPKCFGSGMVNLKPSEPEPPIPVELQEHMRRAWFDYHHKAGATPKEQILLDAIQKIIDIKHKLDGGDWDEIAEAQAIAIEAQYQYRNNHGPQTSRDCCPI